MNSIVPTPRPLFGGGGATKPSLVFLWRSPRPAPHLRPGSFFCHFVVCLFVCLWLLPCLVFVCLRLFFFFFLWIFFLILDFFLGIVFDAGMKNGDVVFTQPFPSPIIIIIIIKLPALRGAAWALLFLSIFFFGCWLHVLLAGTCLVLLVALGVAVVVVIVVCCCCLLLLLL